MVRAPPSCWLAAAVAFAEPCLVLRNVAGGLLFLFSAEFRSPFCCRFALRGVSLGPSFCCFFLAVFFFFCGIFQAFAVVACAFGPSSFFFCACKYAGTCLCTAFAGVLADDYSSSLWAWMFISGTQAALASCAVVRSVQRGGTGSSLPSDVTGSGNNKKK